MGKGFGELARARGIIKYSLSPFEQKAFAGAVSLGVPNMFRRFRGQFLRVVPPFIIGYMIYDYVETKHKQLMRKNPADYENDV
ncbi:ubiquinol-cytochrome c reductase ubiquinone-binding protein [Oratosquilla oratoria]|uniref:ubiquinol-cytochrome c reductase ubiquinone-binding protein n=1 Tax=Oratosquilla oratoria TaxID=337810 RepID=UPI003F758B18